jgi:hypothetical protein
MSTLVYLMTNFHLRRISLQIKELGGPWKGAVLAYFEVHKQHFPREKKENRNKRDGVEIRTQTCPDIQLK